LERDNINLRALSDNPFIKESHFE
ncbi:hypothetical protein D026_4379, partial [Vibrio parahaemolyticus 605]